MLPKDKLGFYQRVRALAPLAQRRGGAVRLVESVLALWLKQVFPKLSHAELRQTKSLCALPKVQALAKWLAERELPDSAFWLSSAYAAWVGEDVRRDRAMVFTPPILSTRLIDDLANNGASFTNGVFMDTACGGAAFLVPVAIRMREELKEKGLGPAAIIEHIRTHLIGVDLDPTLCRMSSFFLKMTLYEDIVAAGKEPQFNVRSTNALTELGELFGKIDVVLCNPPYRKMPPDEVAKYRKRFGAVIEGQPNLYALFFALALKLLRPNGTAALLTATSFLSGQYFSKLRTHLLEHAYTRQIDIIGDRNGVFIGVELETAITVFRKRASPAASLEQTEVFAPRRANGFDSIGVYALPNSGAAWTIPRSAGDAEAIRAANGSQFRLTDYGYRPRIGAFVWNRDQRKRFHSESAARKGAQAPFPLIWSSDIGQDGKLVFNRHKDERRDAFVDMGRIGHVSVISQPCIALQRVTSNDQSRRLVAAPVKRAFIKKHGGVVGENHVVFIEQVTKNPALSPSQLAKVLRSQPIDRLFRSISGSTNVSAFELSQLPMPEPHALAREIKHTADVGVAVLRAFLLQQKE